MRLFLFISLTLFPMFVIADSDLETYRNAVQGKTGAELNSIIKKLSDDGNKYARYEIAKRTVVEKGKEELGEKMLRYLFDNGMVEAGYSLYDNYADKGSRLHNEKAATALILQIARLGESEAARLAGVRYLYGMGIEKNLKKAKKFLEAAADKGNYSSATLLAIIYISEKNYDKAVPLLKIGMNSGDLTAVKFLAFAYEEGSGVEKDIVSAYALFSLFIYQYKKIYKTSDGLEDVRKSFARLDNVLSRDEKNDAISLASKLSLKLFSEPEKDRLKELLN